MEQTEKAKPDLSALRIHRDDDEGSGARRGLRVVLLGTVLILVAAAMLVGYRMWGTATMPEVEVARAIVESGSAGLEILTATGYIVADRKAAVSPKISGRLEYLGVDTGSRVKTGQIIACELSVGACSSRSRAGASARQSRSGPGKHAEESPRACETNESA